MLYVVHGWVRLVVDGQIMTGACDYVFAHPTT